MYIVVVRRVVLTCVLNSACITIRTFVIILYVFLSSWITTPSSGGNEQIKLDCLGMVDSNTVEWITDS